MGSGSETLKHPENLGSQVCRCQQINKVISAHLVLGTSVGYQSNCCGVCCLFHVRTPCQDRHKTCPPWPCVCFSFIRLWLLCSVWHPSRAITSIRSQCDSACFSSTHRVILSHSDSLTLPTLFLIYAMPQQTCAARATRDSESPAPDLTPQLHLACVKCRKLNPEARPTFQAWL